MALNRVKLGRAVTFMKFLARVVSLIFLPTNFNLKENHVSANKFTKSDRAGGK